MQCLRPGVASCARPAAGSSRPRPLPPRQATSAAAQRCNVAPRGRCSASRHRIVVPLAAAANAGGGDGGDPGLERHLRDLDQEQLEAVRAPLGMTYVRAGPGSGKTRVLTSRVAELMHWHGASPWQIMAFAFTNKAAGELKARLQAMGEASEKVAVLTFHSLCFELLRTFIGQELPGAGRTNAFTVYDPETSKQLLELQLGAERPGLPDSMAAAAAGPLQVAISRVKSSLPTWHMGTPEEAAARFEEAALELLSDSGSLESADLGLVPSATKRKERLDLLQLFEWDVDKPALPPKGVRELKAAWLARQFASYEARLRANDALDYDDLLSLAVALLSQEGSELLGRLQDTFKHTLVDEFQDINQSQFELLRLLQPPKRLGEGRRSLFVVGDPDQSIYGWRGAVPDSMTRLLHQNYPGMQLKILHTNYRSGPNILAAARHLISKVEDATRPQMRTLLPLSEAEPLGGQVQDHKLEDEGAEADFIADEIQELLSQPAPEENEEKKLKPREIAVLYRRHAQAGPIVAKLKERGVSFVLAGKPFWERPEIQELMAYLRLVVGLRDEVALHRMLTCPASGIGNDSLRQLWVYAHEHCTTVPAMLFGSGAATRAARGDGEEGSGAPAAPPQLPELDGRELGLGQEAAAALERFCQLVVGLHDMALAAPLDALLQQIVDQTKYKELVMDVNYEKNGTPEERWERVQRLIELAGKFKSMPDSLDLEGAAAPKQGQPLPPLKLALSFLAEPTLHPDADEQDEEGIRLMTVHACKGLEFKKVFIAGCTEWAWLHWRRSDKSLAAKSWGPSPAELRAAIRTMYVGWTRTMELLMVTSPVSTQTPFGSAVKAQRFRFIDDALDAGRGLAASHGSTNGNGAGPLRRS